MKNKFVYRYKTKKAKIDKQTYNPKSHHTIHLSKTQQLYETTCKHTFIPQYSREQQRYFHLKQAYPSLYEGTQESSNAIHFSPAQLL